MADRQFLFETVANEGIMGILAFDAQTGHCTYANRFAREALGLPGNEKAEPGLILSDLFPVTEGRTRNANLIRPLTAEMLKSQGFIQDVLLGKKNDGYLIANVGVRKIDLTDGCSSLLLMFEDITIQKKLQREIQAKQEEIKRALNELIEQNRQLKDLDHAKDRFIALTTHELRTPLAAVISTAEVLVLKLYESEEQKEQFINVIHEQSQHLMELVNDILDFSKIRAGKVDFHVERVDLTPLVDKLCFSFAQMALQSEVSIRFFPPPAEQLAYVDVLRFKEVLGNVLNNAIKHNSRGGQVLVRFEGREDFIRISVEDSGPGIPESKQHHVFNEFETAGRVSLHHKGTGLGMPIARHLMQGMGGSIDFTSRENVGTTFFIDVPTGRVLAEDLYRSRTDPEDLAS
jgi:signal transduction histidine kinase